MTAVASHPAAPADIVKKDKLSTKKNKIAWCVEGAWHLERRVWWKRPFPSYQGVSQQPLYCHHTSFRLWNQRPAPPRSINNTQNTITHVSAWWLFHKCFHHHVILQSEHYQQVWSMGTTPQYGSLSVDLHMGMCLTMLSASCADQLHSAHWELTISGNSSARTMAKRSVSVWGLTSHSTHNRSFRKQFLQAKWPNQQCQRTDGNQLVVEIRLESHQNHSTMLQ